VIVSSTITLGIIRGGVRAYKRQVRPNPGEKLLILSGLFVLMLAEFGGGPGRGQTCRQYFVASRHV
jgi:hypothetical protein